MSNSNEEQLVAKTQHIIVRFDVPQKTPQTRMLILCQLGFNVVTIIGVNLDETQAKTIVLDLMHNRFLLGHRSRLECKME
jgi:hypothetical protein